MILLSFSIFSFILGMVVGAIVIVGFALVIGSKGLNDIDKSHDSVPMIGRKVNKPTISDPTLDMYN